MPRHTTSAGENCKKLPELKPAPARKLQSLERSLLALDLKTQRQFNEVYDAIRALTRERSAEPARRGIGFTADLAHKG